MTARSFFEAQHSDEFAAFMAIAEAGSFAQAAASLVRHPSIVSKRLASLEARLGVRLVERSTRRVKLTDAGTAFLERIRLAAHLLQEAEQEAARHSKDATGTLRVSLPGALGRMWLSPLMAEFAITHPGLTVHAEYSETYVDVIAGGFDVCVRAGTLEDSRLVASRLCDQSRILSASPAYLARAGEPRHPSELARHSCLGHTGLSSYPEWHLTRGDTRHTVSIKASTFVSNDGEALLDAARGGVGILGSSNWLVARDIAAGRLVRVIKGWTFDTRSAIYIVRPSVRFTPHKTSALLDFMVKAFRNGPPWMTPELQ